MDRHRVRQPLPLRQLPREGPRQLTLLRAVQLVRKRDLHLDEQPPVGPLPRVGRLPVASRIVGGPRRHVAVFDVLDLVRVAAVLALAGDIVVLRCCRLASRCAAHAGSEVTDRHGFRVAR